MITPELCKRFLEAKAEERKTKDRRLEVEAELVAAAGTLKVEGTTTTQSTGYKVVITTKVTRTLDYQIYSDLKLPPNLSFVSLVPELDIKRMRAIEMVDPAIVAMCVTSKPAKPSIKIEEVTE